MLPTTTIFLTGLLALSCGILANTNGKESSNTHSHHSSDSVIDIDYYSMARDDPAVAGSGSGSLKGDDDTTDDEDLMTSGSGSGVNKSPPSVTEKMTTTTSKPLSACEQLRKASKALIGNYVPRCTNDGDYATMQCRGYPGTGNCWCSDLQGRIIPSTNMNQPNVPDCELGSNLMPCVFEIVQYSRKQVLGAPKPECTPEGYFKPFQCQGSMCYCVTPYGKKVEGTEVFMNDEPNCDITTIIYRPEASTTPTAVKTTRMVIVEELITTKKTHRVHKTPKPEPGYTVGPDVPKTDTDTVKVEELPESEDGLDLENTESEAESTFYEPGQHIMTQPGLLAAIIGGAVVTLLCAILLIMFIVYRMRKKDEGSYALDEPRKLPNYSYHRAEKDKEFYA